MPVHKQVYFQPKKKDKRIFYLWYFSSIESTWSTYSYPKIFLNSVLNSPRYSYSKFDWSLYIIATSQNKIVSNGSSQTWMAEALGNKFPPISHFLFDSSFKVQESFSKFSNLACRYFKYLATIICSGEIWHTATYSATSLDWPPHIQGQVLT
jgi:hypothetical protein